MQIQKEGFLTQTAQVRIARSQRVKREFTLARSDGSRRSSLRFSTASARLIEKAGKVEVSRVGSSLWIPGEVNVILQAGDRLQTGANSRASLQLADETLLRIGELSLIECSAEQPKAGPAQSLLRGILYFFHRKDEIQIRTPDAVAGAKG
jgi:hypothetical protein